MSAPLGQEPPQLPHCRQWTIRSPPGRCLDHLLQKRPSATDHCRCHLLSSILTLGGGQSGRPPVQSLGDRWPTRRVFRIANPAGPASYSNRCSATMAAAQRTAQPLFPLCFVANTPESGDAPGGAEPRNTAAQRHGIPPRGGKRCLGDRAATIRPSLQRRPACCPTTAPDRGDGQFRGLQIPPDLIGCRSWGNEAKKSDYYKGVTMTRKLASLFVLALAMAAVACSSAQAGVRVGIGIGIGVPVPVYRPYPYYYPYGYYYGPRVYVAPAPVYVVPRPVYVAPAPVYVQPAPVYAQPRPSTLSRRPSTLSRRPSTLSRRPSTLSRRPSTPNPRRRCSRITTRPRRQCRHRPRRCLMTRRARSRS